MSRNDGIDALDPRFPIRLDSPCPMFWQALRPWWCHSSAFAMAESERTGRQAAQRAETFVLAKPQLTEAEVGALRERFKDAMRTGQVRVLDDDLPAVTFARAPYPQLEPDTLAHEFTETDRDRLAWTLGELPEMMP